MSISGKKNYYIWIFFILLSCALIGNKVMAEGDEHFYSEVLRLEKAVKKIDEFYVEKISSKELVQAAIQGIKGILDPHTDYFTKEKYDDLKVSTEGAFGGLGITIAIRDNILTIITPLQDTPAFRMGLQAGDMILEIDGESTIGITINGAVDKLRGKPGTSVTIKVGREGAVEPIDYTVIRDIIRIQSVPFASMLNDTVGYVKITQFSKRTDEDLKEKVLQLKKDGASALILDLRNNPGGLLNQAISVSDLFLPKSKLVVFTKGRVRSQNKEYFSESGPVWGGQQKLIILVNEGSASASEIVAGAIQDHDRGLIMGKTSFGKGSVQTILPLDQDNNALKLTTAYYYTPSGRCINKIENAMQKIRDKAKAEEDSAASKDSAEVFTTDGGRKVHARGGITPDIEVEGNLYDRYLREMERRTMFFKFIVKVRPRLEKAGKVTLNTQISSKITDEYKDFIMNDSAFTQFKSASHIMLEEFAKTMEKERKSVGDTLKSKINNEIDMLKTSLTELLVQKTKMEFDKNLDYIKYALKRELLQASLGDSARNVHEISIDKQVKKAMEYLSDTKLYKSALVAQKD